MPTPKKKTRPSGALTAPCFAAVDLGGGEAELTLYGDVMENEPRDWWTGEPTGEQAITSERINAEMDKLRGASRVTVRLNSGGGDAYTGIGIYNALKALDAEVTVRIEGLAASAASVIACAGDTVVALPGSVLMVHDPMLPLCGWYSTADLDALREDTEACHRALCDIYVKRTGMDMASVEEMVRSETWLVGSEIVDAGFADEYDAHAEADPDEVEQEEGGTVIAGVLHDLSACRRVPDLAARVAASVRTARAVSGIAPLVASVGSGYEQKPATTTQPPEAVTAPVANTEEPPQAAPERGEGPMDLTELRTQHPDLVAEIEAAAAKHERDRLAAIDEIAAGIPADMVADAKYTNPVSAEALALAAIKADAKAGRQHMADAMADAADSGVEDVEAAPGTDDPQAAADAVAADAAAYAARIVNQINGKEVR